MNEYRALKHLSQQELSVMSGVSVRTIQRIEKNLTPGSPYIVKSICRALLIDIDSLELPKAARDRDEAPEIPDNMETVSSKKN